MGAHAAELAGRPETFFGRGRAFAVEGRTGKEWNDVTVAVRRAPDDRWWDDPSGDPKSDEWWDELDGKKRPR